MKKLKQLMLTLLIVVLSVTLMIGGSGLSAFAAAAQKNIIGNGTNATTINLPTSVELGERIYVGNHADVTVKMPNNSNGNIEGTTDKYVVATMLGNYVISYTANGKTYQYSVNCKLDTELEFRVDHDGATIPTYIEAATDKFELPKAYIYEKDDDGEFNKAKDTDYKVEVYLNNKLDDRSEIELPIGTHVIQYFATYKSGKTFSKEFTVKAQKKFNDTVSPTMSISGIPSEASLNTKVTLPKATASDDYDQNVYVEITVKHNNENVAKVKLDDYGYAKEYDLDSADKKIEVDFDNVYNLSFYPRELGNYKVEYQAFDDAGNKSVKHTHDIDVLDKTAPKLEKIADDQIPEKWGKQVKTVASKDTNDGYTNGTITFPMPEYSDNDLDENIQVSFEIRDTVNNNTVIKFSNIYGSENEIKYVYNADTPSKGLYKTDENGVEFKSTGFEFDFSKYTSNVPDLTTTGKYTAIYQARDGKPNITTKSYDITLDNKFDDTKAPVIEFVDEGEYLFVTDKYQDYTLPLAKVTDAIDARPTVEYTLTTATLSLVEGTNLTAVANNSIKVDNGATIEIKAEYIKYDDKEYKFSGDLSLKVIGTDDVGNSDNETTKVTIISSEEARNNIVLGITSNLNPNKFQLGTPKGFNLGSLTVNTVDKDYRKFAGFELSLTNPDQKLIDGLSLETYYYNNTMHIEKLNFTPSKKGIYTLTVRAFDVSGRSIVSAFEFEVEGDDNTGDPLSSKPIPTTGNVNVSYKLQNEEYTPIGDVDGARKYIARRIENAGKFSLMGIEFTAYTAGRYTFTDGYYTEADGPDKDNFKAINKAYNVKIDETSNPVFSLLDRMPTHVAKDVDANGVETWPEIRLPKAIAYTEFTNATVDITVTAPSSKILTKGTELTEDGDKYVFTPDEHGEYTVTYTASVGSSSKVNQSYTIKVGDTIPPSFEIKGTHNKSALQDGGFKFFEVDFDADSNDDELADITFTKKLIDPSGEVVYTASATGSTGAAKVYDSTDEQYIFVKTGSYTVEYTATDKVGNYSIIKETINVTASGKVSAVPLKVVRTVLIIVGVVLIGGVLLYFVRYRKRSNVRR